MMIREGLNKCVGEMGAYGASVLYSKTGKSKNGEPVLVPIGFVGISDMGNTATVALFDKSVGDMSKFHGIEFFVAMEDNVTVDYTVFDKDDSLLQKRVHLSATSYDVVSFGKYLNEGGEPVNATNETPKPSNKAKNKPDDEKAASGEGLVVGDDTHSPSEEKAEPELQEEVVE